MLKLPKFPINCKTKEGVPFKALFKPTGNPKTIKINIVLSKTKADSITIPVPSDEVLNWCAIASKAYLDLFPPEIFTNVLKDPSNEKVFKKANQYIQSDVVVAPLESEKIIKVMDALVGEKYRTAQSTDPERAHNCIFEGINEAGEYILNVYFPTHKEWKIVLVKRDYKLKPTNKELKMSKKVMSASKNPKPPSPQPASKNAPQAHSSNGLTVYEAWGKAFLAHGTNPNAPKLIVDFMQKQFPGRKTDWARWVNPVRARYNSGKLPGANAPAEKIKPYKPKK